MAESVTQFSPHPDVLATRLPTGDIVLLHVSAGTYFTLNETGAFVWTQCEAGLQEEAIAAALLATYDVDPEQAQRCVADLLQQLAAEQLVTAHQPT